MRLVQSAPRLVLAASLFWLAGGLTPGANAHRPPQHAPARASPERGTDLLAIDFAVVTADGSPVPDLRPDEISIKLGGRARPLRSLQLIDVAAPQTAEDEPLLPSPFASNATSEVGRTIALVIDDDSFRPGREGPLRLGVDRLLSGLAGRDRISLVTVPYGGVKVPWTSEHVRVRTALSHLVGQGVSNESGSSLACRTRRTLESLIGYLQTLGIRESPATVLFVTAGLAAPRRDAPIMFAPGSCELPSELFRQVGAAGAAARARFYVIQPEDIMVGLGRGPAENIAGAGYLGSDNPVEGIEHLTGATAGKMLNLTGSAETAFGRVLRETASYYLAAVDAQRGERSGRPLALDVRVNRAGVEIRSRGSIAFAPPDALPSRPANPSPRDMIKVATVFRDLPLRAGGYSAPEPVPGGLRVIALAEPIEPGVKFASLVAALFDRDGRLSANWVATPADLERLPVMGAMLAKPGAYRLRVAALDTTGRSGTVDYHLDAELAQTGTLRLSSIVLGLSREGGFVPRLQFGTEPVVIGYLEMQGAAPGARLSAVLELASTPNGPALVEVPLAIKLAAENRYIATGALPIGALAPADYIVRAIVGLEGQAATRVVRTLRKVRP